MKLIRWFFRKRFQYILLTSIFALTFTLSEFYRKSTDVLLELRDDERNIANQYRANEKRLVLQKLALYNQDNAQAQQQDRRSINYETVLAEIKKVLPSLNLNPNQDTQEILREIVERSGLFIQIDSGDKYQFAHLSIQEFFAAEALTDNWHGLIVRYKKDPNAWRETVKLWCGLAGESTKLIRAVYPQDALLAFECLADAQKIDLDLAFRIINQSKMQLGSNDNKDNLVKAFGTVAASSRNRGRAVFEFLRETLALKSESLNRRSAAALALSLTNSIQAAQALADQYNTLDDAEVRQALVRMGDLAVPKLVSKANEGYLVALNDLLAIATPNSANALVSFLWHSDQELASVAAWNLATLLPRPDMEESLHNYRPTEQQQQADYLDWIWQPFPTPKNSALPIIAGRIAYLLKIAPRSAIFPLEQKLDPRIIIPLCAIELKHQGNFINRWNPDLDSLLAQMKPTSQLNSLITQLLNGSNVNSRWKLLFSGLSPRLQLDILRRLSNYHPPKIVDWRNLFRTKVQYEFKNSWHYKLILIFSQFISILAFGKIIQIIGIQPEKLSNGLLNLAILIVIIFWNFCWTGIKGKLEPNTYLSLGLFGFLNFGHELYRFFNMQIFSLNIQALRDFLDDDINHIPLLLLAL